MSKTGAAPAASAYVVDVFDKDVQTTHARWAFRVCWNSG